MPCVFRDETSGTDIFTIPDGGTARIGIRATPDASAILVVQGTIFVNSSSQLANTRCDSGAAGPVTGSVTIGAGGTSSVSTGLSQSIVVGSGDGRVNADTAGTLTFINNGITSVTYDYSYF